MNERQFKFFQGVLLGKPLVEAYKAAGYRANGNAAYVNASKLLDHPEIQEELHRHREEALAGAKRRLALEVKSSIEMIVRIRDSKEVSSSVQLRAAQDLLDRAGLKPSQKTEIEEKPKIIVVKRDR